MRTRLLALVLLLGAAGSLGAHDLFIKLDSYFLEPDRRVRVALLNGTFTRSENAIARDRIRDVSLAHGGGRGTPAGLAWSERNDTTFAELRTGAPGTYVLGVSLEPATIHLAGEDFNAYLREEGLARELAERERAGLAADSAVERYAKHVKAIVQVGDARTEDFAAVLGYPAELVPLANPYQLRPGDTLRVRALVEGAPAPGLAILAGWQPARGRVRRLHARQTDSAGVAAIPLRAAGRWYVKFIHLAPTTDDGLDYESRWATMTFEIGDE